MNPLPLDPEQPKQSELPIADINFLLEMHTRSGELAAQLATSREKLGTIQESLAAVGIERQTTARVLFDKTFATAKETGASLGIDVRCDRQQLSISSIVGDSRNRQDLAPYRALVDLKAGRFRAARQAAQKKLRGSGAWPLSAELLGVVVCGEYAIAALRLAGFLRACRIVEVVDVVRHAATVDGLASRFETA